jgi:hypothetical protein
MLEQQQSANDQARARIEKTFSDHLAVADFLIEHTDLLVSLSETVMTEKMPDDKNAPYVGFYTTASGIYFTVYGGYQRDTMRTLRRGLGGKWNKRGYGDTFTLTQYIGPLYVTISGDREQVCQKVVIGTETREVPEVPYQPAKTEVVEQVEWVCGNLLDD